MVARRPLPFLLPVLFLAVLPVLTVGPPARLRAADAPGGRIEARVASIVSLLAEREGDRFWSLVARLETLGPEAVPALEARLGSESERARLGCAKALLSLGSLEARSRATEALGELAQDARDPGVRIDAIEIYGLAADPDGVLAKLEGLLESETDAQVLIVLARTLWEVDNIPAARDRLLALLESRDLDVRNEAALALAEGGNYENGTVKDILRRLKKEPTPRGRRAALLYRLMQLESQVDSRLFDGSLVPEAVDEGALLQKKEERIRELEAALAGRGAGGNAAAGSAPETEADRLFEEVIRQIQEHHVSAEKTEREELVLSAIRGMVRAMDEHSLFLEAEQAKDFDQGLHGRYPGIGAHISKPTGGPLEVLRPIYGGPAYRAGILSGDTILEIEGRSTPELKLEELKELLRGPRGTTVTLKILRRGWSEPQTFQLVRETIELSSVFYEALPEGIGYLRLVQFGDDSDREFIAALETLEAERLEGLIIDLRSNPGGELKAATRIADLFVSGKLPLVTQKGRGGEGENEHRTYPTPDARTGYPIAVLVNEHSASASEVVAGALQDYGRAAIVGTRTFGKGSVQSLINLRAREGSQLKLTVQYWYLPLGRCIHTVRDAHGRVLEQGGIEPDIAVEEPSSALWRLEERSNLRNHEKILSYVDEHFDELQSLVPLGDRGDPGVYLEFEALYRSLGTHALATDVRQVIRYNVRRRMEDARGREFAFDLGEDVQLQRAVLYLLERMDRPAAETEYAWIPGITARDAPEARAAAPGAESPRADGE